VPAAIKYGRAGGATARALAHEASVYRAPGMQQIQVRQLQCPGCVCVLGEGCVCGGGYVGWVGRLGPGQCSADREFGVWLVWGHVCARRCTTKHSYYARACFAMHLLQGVYIPRLLHYGHATGRRVVLATSRVFGRPLRGDGRDAHLLPQALAALRAAHAAGFLHGDVRLPNFMLVEGGQDTEQGLELGQVRGWGKCGAEAGDGLGS
jgi:hypothetical protein